jgi:hypothetical protein
MKKTELRNLIREELLRENEYNDFIIEYDKDINNNYGIEMLQVVNDLKDTLNMLRKI